MKGKQFLSLLLAGALILTLMPFTALAASDTGTYTFDVSEGGITIGAGTVSGLKVSYGASKSVDNIPGTQEITITGTTTANTVTVNSGVTANITLNAVNINLPGSSGVCAFDMTGATVMLKLIGSSTLISGAGGPGILCPLGAELTIADGTSDGTGMLTVTSNGSCGAGIGAAGSAGGTVTITGGTVTATGGNDGAGIGGGAGGNGGTVYISGGTVTATGGDCGAGIGGGYSGAGGTVYISGGTVTATGGFGGAGIGGGFGGAGGTVYISGGSVKASGDTANGAENIGHGYGGSGGTLMNKPAAEGGVNVYLTTVTLDGVSAETAVSALTTDAGYPYGANGMKTDADGKLYLYLPDGKSALAAETASVCYTGKVTASSSSSVSGTLDPGDFTVTGSGYTYPNHVLTIAAGGDCAVSMRSGVSLTTADKIAVTGSTATNTNITLNGVGIDLSSAGGCAFELQGSSVVNLTLSGTNTLTSGGSYAGLKVPAGTTLTVNGTGSLSATSGIGGAGIGGGVTGSGGTITISGGTVTATGGDGGGAGIGGGNSGDGGTVTISGGTVTATGGIGGGAGIGGGYGGNGGTVYISGGTVTATGKIGAGIGGGQGGNGGTVYISGGTVTAMAVQSNAAINGDGIGGGGQYHSGNGSKGAGGTCVITGGSVNVSSMGPTPTNGASNGNQTVCLTTVTLADASASPVRNSLISALTASLNNSNYAYGTTDMYTDANGKLYLYLPAGAAITQGVSSSLHYTGSVTSNNLGTAAGPLTLLAVTGVTPSGTNAALSGSVAVTFSKEMDTSAGTVSLTGGAALTGGSWSADAKTYTVPYSGLSYGTLYAVTITGFQDAAGNTMTDDGSHSFTTTAQSSGGSGGSFVTRYTITAAAGTGGSISPSGSASVTSGNDKTYTITADEGYEIEDVLVDGVSVGAVSTYPFNNVTKAHTIAASFKKDVANPFTDMNADDWFYDNVMYVYEKGLMTGTGGGMFAPNGTLTRGMFVTILYRMSGDDGTYANPFSDVPSGEWYEQAAAWASANGITGGVGNGQFNPNGEITREQLAVMLYNYAKYKGYDVSADENTNILSYNDALTISDYAYSALQWACGAGILNGDTSGNLNPQGSATRAEAAAMLQRFMENVKG